MKNPNDLVDKNAPIAIVGMGGLFPGSVDIASFWGHILAKSDLITDVPSTHWRVEDYFDADPSRPDKTYAKVGGFLPNVQFDALANGIPPSLMSSTDTSQLLALLVARTTLEDAFHGKFADADKAKISCILGVTSGQELFGQMASRLRRPEWEAGLRAAGLDEATVKLAADKIGDAFVPWTESSFPGLLGNVVAGRIANRLDLGGTNAVTDAACASSFAAIAMGIDELKLGRADVVLTGGVDTLNDIFMYMCFSKTPALSAKGRIRPFDVDADGTLLGEGLGMIALKRLSDAERDGDAIYAVIKGVGTSSDGRSKSVYAPVSEGQANALSRAYEAAGYDPNTVELIEAHGTGTKAGDVAEMGGLKLVFANADRGDDGECAVGTVKSQIGHTKSAAGAAGLIKAALAVNDGVLPPTINIDAPNPKLGLDDGPLYLNTETRPWIRGHDHPRRAGVSSFGFGGSNWHITVEEYQGQGTRAPRLTPRPGELFLFSGASFTDVKAQLSSLKARLSPDVPFSSLAHENVQLAKADAHVRVAFVAKDRNDALSLVEKAEKTLSAEAPVSVPGVFVGVGQKAGKLAFLFSGQGSQYVGMGSALAIHVDDARRVFDAGDGKRDGQRPLSRVLFPRPRFDDAARTKDDANLRATENAQPALAVVETAILHVLKAAGVQPDLVAGHSFGELTALYAAGACTFDDLLEMARKRGQRMAEASAVKGAMAAVSASAADVAKILSTAGLTDVVIANENAPQQTVIGGTVDSIDKAVAVFTSQSIRASKLAVSTAFHSPLVAGAASLFRSDLDALTFNAPTLPVVADVTAEPYPHESAAMKDLLAQQIGAPVKFVDVVEKLYADGARVFVEVGPSTVLTGLVGRILDGRTHQAVATDARGKDGMLSLLSTLGQLFAAGHAVSLEALDARRVFASTVIEPKKRGVSVEISGANVGRPSLTALAASAPAVTKASELAAREVAPAPRVIESAPVLSTTVNPPAPATRPSASVVAPKPSSLSSSNSSTATSSSNSSSTGNQRMSSNANPPKNPAAPSSSWIEVFRDGQRETADAHASFQRALADAHTTFLQTFERSTKDLVSLLSGQVTGQVSGRAVSPASSHVVIAPSSSAGPTFVTQPTAAPAVVSAAAAQTPVQSSPSVSKPSVPALASTMPVAAPTHVVGGPNVKATFMAVVAEKTGYPIDALEDSMSLEADLGIDSIKRVEILSTIKARVPGLPEVDALTLAKLNTLGAVAAALMPNGAVLAPSSSGSARSANPADATTSNVPTPNVPSANAASPSASASDIKAAFKAVVAEKTGYPVDALEDEMSLEADLGIDSIKRVEILSAIKARVPGLPEVDALTLAKLNTLGAVAAALLPNGQAPTSTTTAPRTSTSTSTSTIASASEIKAAFKTVVAEKTGYPVDALEDDMSLEADLGIDSIKRVEILSAIKARVPGLPEVDALTLAKLNTLGAVAAALMPSGPTMTATTTSTSAPSARAPSTTDRTSSTTSSPSDIKAAFKAVVAEKTGYPVDALEDEMSLEADLGIDSIKRVEILSAIKGRVPGLPDVDALTLAKLNTLGAVAAALMPAATASGAALSVSATSDVSNAPSSARARVPVAHVGVVDAPSDTAIPLPSVTGRTIGVFGRSRAHVDAVVTAIARQGGHAEALPIEGLNGHSGRLFGLVLVDGGMDFADTHEARSALTQNFLTVKNALAGLNDHRGQGFLLALTGGGGDFGMSALSVENAAFAGISGLVKTAAIEVPGLRAKVLDVDTTLPADVLAQIVVDELQQGFAEVEIGRKGNVRSARALVLREDPLVDDGGLLHPVTVATGGARGVTAECLIEWAKHTKPRLAILARSARTPTVSPRVLNAREEELLAVILDDAKTSGIAMHPKDARRVADTVLAAREVEANITRLESVGAVVRYIVCDVANSSSVDKALQEAREAFGPIEVLVHGAGVLADKLIADKSTEDLDRVLATKLDGMLHLVAATTSDPLKVVAVFSSVAGRFGNKGQSDYAMANEAITAIGTAMSSSPGVRVKSFAWGPWEGGMVTPALRAHFAHLGVPLISFADGAGRFVEELSSNASRSVEMVIGGAITTPVPRPPRENVRNDAESASPVVIAETVSAATHPSLFDHSIKGQPVFPAAFAVDMMVRTAEQTAHGAVVTAVRDLEVLKGIRFTDFEAGLTIESHVTMRDAVADVELRIGGERAPRYRARVQLGPARTGLGQVVDDAGAAVDVATGPLYAGGPLFHGPAFHLLERVKAGKNGLSAIGRGLARAPLANAAVIDVAAIDSALQLALVHASREEGGAFVPTGIGSIEFSRTGPESTVHLILTAQNQSRDHVTVDVDVTDAERTVVARIKGISVFRIPVAAPDAVTDSVRA